MPKWLDIAVSAPAHSQVGGLLTYASDSDLVPGQLVRVPFGKREVLGVVWCVHDAAPETSAPHTVRHIAAALEGVPALSAHWRQLVQFAAQYYQRAIGEVALAALPPQLRDMTPVQLARRLKKHSASGEQVAAALQSPWPLSEQQQQVLLRPKVSSASLDSAIRSSKLPVFRRDIPSAIHSQRRRHS